MLGGAGNDVLEPGHESLLAKMPLAHVGNHRLPFGSETGFGVAFLGMLDSDASMAFWRQAVFFLAGT
jgi:hypothetical protein